MPKPSRSSTSATRTPKSPKKAAKTSKPPAKRASSSKRGAFGTKPAIPAIIAWEDDPISTTDVAPVPRPVPSLTGTLSVAIAGAAPPPAVYGPATSEFRYWTAADALRRGLDYWASHLPAGTAFQTNGTATLPVMLDDPSEDLNAYYVRARGLEFKHMSFPSRTVYSAECPDIVLHELGHAVLDAVKPELFHAASHEVAAFHESFGDISAILIGAKLSSFAEAALQETGGVLNRSSRLSRLMESLGWGVRQFRPDRAAPDCLRNAVNSWFYQPPDGLPPDGPESVLSSAPHSFSRVFTGGFFEAMSGMLSIQSGGKSATGADLAAVSDDAGKLLVAAVREAPVRPDYMSQVAAHLIVADARLTSGKYREAIRGAMIRRGLLSLEASSSLMDYVGALCKASGRRKAAGASALATDVATDSRVLSSRISGERLGLAGVGIIVSAASQPRTVAAASASAVPRVADVSFDESSRVFVENLLRRGRVRVDEIPQASARLSNSWARKTHVLRPQNGDAELVRVAFDCCGTD